MERLVKYNTSRHQENKEAAARMKDNNKNKMIRVLEGKSNGRDPFPNKALDTLIKVYNDNFKDKIAGSHDDFDSLITYDVHNGFFVDAGRGFQLEMQSPKSGQNKK